jgi:hypothetical protein
MDIDDIPSKADAPSRSSKLVDPVKEEHTGNVLVNLRLPLMTEYSKPMFEKNSQLDER